MLSLRTTNFNMKKLFIARHAKSSWDDFSISDFDRPILNQGKKKTLKVAEALKKDNILPDLIMSSTARRAKETTLLLAQGLGYPVDKIDFKESFYHAYDDEILAELYGLDDSINSVMVVGHNPTLTDLVNQFAAKYIDNLSTSAVACITFKTDDWSKLMTCRHNLDFMLRPGEL